MKFFATLLAKFAFTSARVAAGSASVWTTYQPKEPDMKSCASNIKKSGCRNVSRLFNFENITLKKILIHGIMKVNRTILLYGGHNDRYYFL
jgi:cyclic lactone autoinducer peptide